MVFKKTEYSREYRGPQWNQHFNHYKEKVDYRLQRRHLEHFHQPFEWESDEDEVQVDHARPQSAPPRPSRKIKERSPPPQRQQQQQQHNNVPALSLPVDDDQIQANYNRNNSNQPPPPDTQVERRVKPKRPRPKSAKPTTTKSKVPPKQKQVPLFHPPFLAFGWADRERMTGRQRTHNVKAAVADSQFIYPAALRARKRQELDVARQREMLERENYRKKRERALFNEATRDSTSPWQTEYQRQYSANRAKRC